MRRNEMHGQELQVMVDPQIKEKKEAAEQVKLSIRQSLDKQMRDSHARAICLDYACATALLANQAS